MDLSPLDILALSEKSALSCVKTSNAGNISIGGQTVISQLTDIKDTDNDSKQQMGKTTSSGLKHTLCVKDTSFSMAPQKWSSETLIPSCRDRITSKLDELVQDMQMKGLDVKLQKTIDNNIHKGVDIKEITVDKKQNYIECDKSFSDFTEDTGNFSDIKLQSKKEMSHVFICAALILDHPYALSSDRLLSPSFEDDDIDIGSDSSLMSEEPDQDCHDHAMSCHYLKFGINDGVSASALAKKCISYSKLRSPSSSISSLTSDINSRSSHSLLSGDENSDIGTGISSPESPSFDHISACPGKPAGTDGKCKPRNFNFSNLELEKLLNHREHTSSKRLDSGAPLDNHFIIYSMHSPSASPNLHPLLQSPTPDWDRSEAGSETQDNSSDARSPQRMSPYFRDKIIEWSHPLFHDHDYYAKDTESISFADDLRKCRRGKRKHTIKNKLDRTNCEKIMKAKYLKKELLRKDSFSKSASGLEPVSADSSVMKTNPVGRPRKRPHDKIVDEIDPETGSKLKITGKFKDQYVYYLSKSSRTTARARHTLAPSLTSDKIIVPAPNHGDIVIPHLTDADIEALRLKGCNTHNLLEKPHLINVSSNPPALHSFIPSSNPSSEFVSDVDSHIVSTILSMENDSIASAEMQETPDIISTTDLNPNQPALTESLRIMSGDPSITSEHVLNYLLSMVKDEVLLGSGRGFDNDNSVLFPSLPLDNSNTRDDHATEPENTVCEDLSLLDRGQDLFDVTKSLDGTRPFTNETVLSSEHAQETHKFGHTNKYFGDESVCLPDDLSSFLSDSKGSVKSTFESDLSLLGMPQCSSNIHRLTSIEKTLDYLGVRDEDMKFDNHVFNAKMDHNIDSSRVLTPVSSTFTDDTPWIVTITLYFNDVPAIMLNNQPHIRLVDIHKQILPAKDTGILKKRCQLLKIPVLCCTEMQRYFLVQYGRAYNSKSTLIVSKDNATDLVTYYATPQPRMARTIEAQPSNPGGNGSLNVRLPVAHLPAEVIKRHGFKGSRKISDLPSLPASKGHGESFKQLLQKDKLQKAEVLTASHSNRTRHKKINYLDLLKGEEKEKSSNSAIVETIKSAMKLPPDHEHDDKSFKISLKKMSKASLSYSNMGNVINQKCTSFYEKKDREMGPKIIQRVKVSKTKKRSKHEKVEPEVEVCSKIDSDGCVNVSQNKKCRPLKLKVNSLLNFVRQRSGSSLGKHSLFSCSNSSTTDRSLRVLSVVHQAALADNSAESSLPSQAADIHLDLFVKPNSTCVRCATCSQFLSVPHFMRHHHVPLDSDWLTTKAAQRVLVPRNKENISQQEQQLWAEFHRLQEAIGGFGEADDETDSDDSDDQCSLDLSSNDNVEQFSLKFPETLVSSPESAERSTQCMEAQSESGLSSTNLDSSSSVKDDKSPSFILYKKLSTMSTPSSSLCHKLSSEILTKTGLVQQNVGNSGLSDAGLHTFIDPGASNTRTSTRKRKSKQFFSIENYYTPKRWAIDEELISQKHVRT